MFSLQKIHPFFANQQSSHLLGFWNGTEITLQKKIRSILSQYWQKVHYQSGTRVFYLVCAKCVRSN